MPKTCRNSQCLFPPKCLVNPSAHISPVETCRIGSYCFAAQSTRWWNRKRMWPLSVEKLPLQRTWTAVSLSFSTVSLTVSLDCSRSIMSSGFASLICTSFRIVSLRSTSVGFVWLTVGLLRHLRRSRLASVDVHHTSARRLAVLPLRLRRCSTQQLHSRGTLWLLAADRYPSSANVALLNTATCPLFSNVLAHHAFLGYASYPSFAVPSSIYSGSRLQVMMFFPTLLPIVVLDPVIADRRSLLVLTSLLMVAISLG